MQPSLGGLFALLVADRDAGRALVAELVAREALEHLGPGGLAVVLCGLTVMLAHVVRHCADSSPALLVGVLCDRAREQLREGRLAFGFGPRLISNRVGDWDEQAAGDPERLGCVRAAESNDLRAALAQEVRQRGEVAVAGDQGVHVRPDRVMQIDGVDHEREICCVLPFHRVGLVNWPDPAVVQLAVPSLEHSLEPVPIGPANSDIPMLCEHCQHLIKAAQRGVVSVDQEGNCGRGVGHASTLATIGTHRT